MIHFMAYRATEHTKNKQAETRSRLLQGAKTLVSENGFRGLSIANAAKSAGIATGTVYRYFPSKTELCIAVFQWATDREIEAVLEATRSRQGARAQLRAGLETFIDRALQSPRLAYALIAEPVDPQLEQSRLQYSHRWAQHFSQIIETGIASGEFRNQPALVSAAALEGAMAETIVFSLATENQATIAQGKPLINCQTRAAIIEFGLNGVRITEVIQNDSR